MQSMEKVFDTQSQLSQFHTFLCCHIIFPFFQCFVWFYQYVVCMFVHPIELMISSWEWLSSSSVLFGALLLGLLESSNGRFLKVHHLCAFGHYQVVVPFGITCRYVHYILDKICFGSQILTNVFFAMFSRFCEVKFQFSSVWAYVSSEEQYSPFEVLPIL